MLSATACAYIATVMSIHQIPQSIRNIQAAAKELPLRAFHGSQELRDYYTARIQYHHDADEIRAGLYVGEKNGRPAMCAVGCSIHSGDHKAYETELGIPSVLARLEDGIFEALFSFDTKVAKEWPVRFISAPRICADLSMVWPRFALWLLIDPEHGVLRFAKTERTRTSVITVADLYRRWIDGDKPSAPECKSAAYAADAAYAAAYAYSAADAAAYAYSAYAASAADAAASYAADAAYAYDAAAAAAASRKASRIAQAEKLLSLMQEAE